MGFRKQVAIKQILPHVSQDETMVQLLFNEARLGGYIMNPNELGMLAGVGIAPDADP